MVCLESLLLQPFSGGQPFCFDFFYTCWSDRLNNQSTTVFEELLRLLLCTIGQGSWATSCRYRCERAEQMLVSEWSRWQQHDGWSLKWSRLMVDRADELSPTAQSTTCLSFFSRPYSASRSKCHNWPVCTGCLQPSGRSAQARPFPLRGGVWGDRSACPWVSVVGQCQEGAALHTVWLVGVHTGVHTLPVRGTGGQLHLPSSLGSKEKAAVTAWSWQNGHSYFWAF